MANSTQNELRANLETIKKSISSDCKYLGFRQVKESTRYFHFRDGNVESWSGNQSQGVMVEALVDGNFSYFATPKMDVESLKHASEQAITLARTKAPKVYPFGTEVRPKQTQAWQGLRAKITKSPKETCEILKEICARLKSHQDPEAKIIRTEAVVTEIDSETTLVSSIGSDSHRDSQMFLLGFEATAQNGNVVCKRSNGGFRGRSYQGGWEQVLSPDFWNQVDQTAKDAIELSKAKPCPTMTGKLVLSPDQMMLQIHESIGHPLELDRILGDERNYAGWSFVRPEDFGKLQYGSKLLNVTFDPTIPHELASYGFDDIGAQATKEFLIKDGVLVRGLGSLESQARLGLKGVSNQRASLWNRPPIDRMANLNIEPGRSTREEIIGSVELGVWMESNISWSIDDFRNKFQFGCEYARMIRNGKLAEVVRNPNYRGISVPFWNSLSMVGDASTFEVYGTPNCGKGEPNQVIRVGHASPICLFDNIEIFGGVA